MNQNNYNVCSKCGTANPLMARYSYQCGTQLKAPQEPIVCPKCNTVNVSSANFCKRCGSKLLKAQSTKYCPQCYTAIPSDSMYCPNCRYDYRTGGMAQQPSYNQLPSPETPPEAPPTAQAATIKVSNAKRKPRVRFLVLLLLTLAITYLAFLPTFLKWNTVDFGTLQFTLNGVAEPIGITGYELALDVLRGFGVVEGAVLVENCLLATIGGYLYLLSALTLVLYVLVCLIRLLCGKGFRKPNWWMFTMFIVSALYAALVMTAPAVLGGETFLKKLYAAMLQDATAVTWGYNFLALPIGFFLLFLLSIFLKVKKKKGKSNVMDIQRPM